MSSKERNYLFATELYNFRTHRYNGAISLSEIQVSQVRIITDIKFKEKQIKQMINHIVFVCRDFKTSCVILFN